MTIQIGNRVNYQGKHGKILWIYKNGTCEFNDLNSNKIFIVSITDLLPVNDFPHR